jgi:hypothetical protein
LIEKGFIKKDAVKDFLYSILILNVFYCQLANAGRIGSLTSSILNSLSL